MLSFQQLTSVKSRICLTKPLWCLTRSSKYGLLYHEGSTSILALGKEPSKGSSSLSTLVKKRAFVSNMDTNLVKSTYLHKVASGGGGLIRGCSSYNLGLPLMCLSRPIRPVSRCAGERCIAIVAQTVPHMNALLHATHLRKLNPAGRPADLIFDPPMM